MKNNSNYLITSAEGTNLEFTARQWIPLDFEVCTAPIEDTIQGTIVVDGAVFFRKNQDEKIVIKIGHGKVTSIEAYDDQSETLAKEYKEMIARAIEDPANLQLAEIGIGFCHGAKVSDCFMEAETVVGTCHFCFGNNVCYGGNNASEFHGNSVLIQNPEFTVIQ